MKTSLTASAEDITPVLVITEDVLGAAAAGLAVVKLDADRCLLTLTVMIIWKSYEVCWVKPF